VVMID